MFACTSLVNSSLNKEVEFITLDTTASTNKKRSLVERGLGGMIRMTKFIALLSTRKVDTVMAFCSSGYSFKEKGAMIKIAKALGKKTIIAPRSGHLIDDIENSSSFKKSVAAVFQKADHIICQGSFWQSYFNDHFQLPSDKTVVIHNWIDQKIVKRSKKNSKNLKILFLGWIEKNKGIYEIIEAADQLRDENVEWIIGGNGKEFEEVSALVSRKELQDKVQLKGWVLHEDKERHLASSDILIIPSYREGLPNALLEAMLNGLAVIASNVGGIPDIVQNKNNGILINPGDANAIVSAVKFFLTNPEKTQEFGLEAIETIKTKNSLETAISKFNEVL